MTPKAEPADDEGQERKPQEITRLAIGKPGGIDAEADKWETAATVVCATCKKDIPMNHPKVASMVDSIMLAQSAYTADAVGEWEQELRTCPCTSNLDQSAASKIAAKSMASCSKCDLKTNLWLCMTCGHLGCGRRYYDGSGGNNHGVEHWELSKHSVALKLGTITPEGTASIHCYKCDDDVLDDKLAEHLAVLGIDITTQVKTEKTMAELNLQANLNLTLSKVLEEGKKLNPVFGPGLTGMENLGNSCYMNSIVQVLFSLPEFKEHFYTNAEEHLAACANYSPNCYQCQTSKLAVGLYSGEYSQKKIAQKVVTEENKDEEQKDEFYQDGIRPQIFKSLVGKGHQDFAGGQQQDCREYFTHLLERMLLGEKKAGSK